MARIYVLVGIIDLFDVVAGLRVGVHQRLANCARRIPGEPATFG